MKEIMDQMYPDIEMHNGYIRAKRKPEMAVTKEIAFREMTGLPIYEPKSPLYRADNTEHADTSANAPAERRDPCDWPDDPTTRDWPECDKAGWNPKDIAGSTKPNLALIPPAATVHLALPLMDGADKYGAYNWRDIKVRAMVYIGAIKRHIECLLDGEDYVHDSRHGSHHMASIMASAAIYLDAMETGCLIDNRPKKGVAAALIRRLTAPSTA